MIKIETFDAATTREQLKAKFPKLVFASLHFRTEADARTWLESNVSAMAGALIATTFTGFAGETHFIVGIFEVPPKVTPRLTEATKARKVHESLRTLYGKTHDRPERKTIHDILEQLCDRDEAFVAAFFDAIVGDAQ